MTVIREGLKKIRCKQVWFTFWNFPSPPAQKWTGKNNFYCFIFIICLHLFHLKIMQLSKKLGNCNTWKVCHIWIHITKKVNRPSNFLIGLPLPGFNPQILARTVTNKFNQNFTMNTSKSLFFINNSESAKKSCFYRFDCKGAVCPKKVMNTKKKGESFFWKADTPKMALFLEKTLIGRRSCLGARGSWSWGFSSICCKKGTWWLFFCKILSILLYTCQKQ